MRILQQIQRCQLNQGGVKAHHTMLVEVRNILESATKSVSCNILNIDNKISLFSRTQDLNLNRTLPSFESAPKKSYRIKVFDSSLLAQIKMTKFTRVPIKNVAPNNKPTDIQIS